MLVMKLIFLGFELLTYYFLRKLLIHYKKDDYKVFWYWLCLGFVGNLHHECIFIAFLLASIFYVKEHKILWAAIFLSLAIFTKFTPLMFVSFFIFSLSRNDAFKYVLIVTMSCVTLLIPMYYQDGYLYLFKSIQLYFGSFEFNSSLYYLSTYVEWVLARF